MSLVIEDLQKDKIVALAVRNKKAELLTGDRIEDILAQLWFEDVATRTNFVLRSDKLMLDLSAADNQLKEYAGHSVGIYFLRPKEPGTHNIAHRKYFVDPRGRYFRQKFIDLYAEGGFAWVVRDAMVMTEQEEIVFKLIMSFCKIAKSLVAEDYLPFMLANNRYLRKTFESGNFDYDYFIGIISQHEPIFQQLSR